MRKIESDVEQTYGSRVVTAEGGDKRGIQKENRMHEERGINFAFPRSREMISEEKQDRRHLTCYSRLGRHCIRPYRHLVDDHETDSSQRLV